MLPFKVDGCWMGVFGTGLLELGFWGRVSFMTGCFARTRIEPGGRRMHRGRTEDGRRFDGREGGQLLHSKVDGCCMDLFWDQTIGTEILGTGFL